MQFNNKILKSYLQFCNRVLLFNENDITSQKSTTLPGGRRQCDIFCAIATKNFDANRFVFALIDKGSDLRNVLTVGYVHCTELDNLVV